MATYSKGANVAFPGKVGSETGSSGRSVDHLRGLSKKSSNAATKPLLAHRTGKYQPGRKQGRKWDIP
mgnify:CR=1 FL=1